MTRHAVTPLRHERILASAGSGKTFRLSGRLIEIVRRTPHRALSQVLASTFTRAAAAEIRDRVFLRLAAAVLDADKRRELAVGTGLPPPDEAEARALLGRFAAAIDQLQLRTLDSLFASTAAAFACELGLPSEPRIASGDELEQLKLDAIDRMLATEDAPRLLVSVAALSRGRQRLTVASAALEATEGAASILAESEEGAWEWPEIPIDDAAALSAHMEALAACPMPPDRVVENALTKDIGRLREAMVGDLDAWSKALSGGLLKALREGRSTFSRKPIPPAVVAALTPFIAHGEALGYAETLRRTDATRVLASTFLDAFAHVKRERGVVTFDDITRAVAEASTLPEFGELFFRLDAIFAHALLDEFQDTSAVQWRALAPIARELAAGDAGERSLFVVGDLKQSIYRWRGATPELLERLPDLVLEEGRVEMVDDPMTTSYRSAQVVLDAVDAVCASLPGNPALAEAEDAVARAAEGWRAAWAPHTAERNLSGVVELHVAESVAGRSDSTEQQALTMGAAARLVADLRAEAPHATIGVLCRRNSKVGDMLNRLRDLGVAASARGGGSLQDAASVNAALDALVLADHPDHTIACFHVAHSPLGPVLELAADAHRPEQVGHRHARSASIRRTLARLGYAETLRRWRDALEDAIDDRELARFDDLIEAASVHDGGDEPARRPADAVRSLRALELDERSEAPVTVMNIHQSKGLEFDAVVLCDIDRSFQMRAPLAAMRTRPDGRFTRVIRWPARGLMHPLIAPIVGRVTEEAYREHLSMLYVALTRARRGLFVVTGRAADSKGEASFPNSFAGLVRGAWCPGRTEPGVERISGDRSALLDIASRDVGREAEPVTPRRPIVIGPPKGVRVGAAASASARTTPLQPARSAPATTSGEARAARDRGVAVHAMLERIEWLADGDPSLEDLMQAGRTALPRLSERDLAAHASWLIMALRAPSLRSLLARPADAFLVHREFRFVRVDGALLERGTIDRLVLHGGPDRLERATIVDFKTDRGDDDVRAVAEGYRPQLEAYRRAVCQRFRLPADRVSVALALLERGIVSVL